MKSLKAPKLALIAIITVLSACGSKPQRGASVTNNELHNGNPDALALKSSLKENEAAMACRFAEDQKQVKAIRPFKVGFSSRELTEPKKLFANNKSSWTLLQEPEDFRVENMNANGSYMFHVNFNQKKVVHTRFDVGVIHSNSAQPSLYSAECMDPFESLDTTPASSSETAAYAAVESDETASENENNDQDTQSDSPEVVGDTKNADSKATATQYVCDLVITTLDNKSQPVKESVQIPFSKWSDNNAPIELSNYAVGIKAKDQEYYLSFESKDFKQTAIMSAQPVSFGFIAYPKGNASVSLICQSN